MISACSSISIHISSTLRNCSEDVILKLEEMFELMPRLVNETLYFWIIRSGLMFIKVQTDLDDQILLEDHCDFIVKLLRFGLSAANILKHNHSKNPNVLIHNPDLGKMFEFPISNTILN